MHGKRVLAMAVLAMWAGAQTVHAAGMLIPKDESLPPLAVQYQRVDIQIKDGAATTKIEQVFKNSTDRDLEAIYVFPLPENASISDFAMTINGKRMSGELVERAKARKVYEDIVRRLKDPGLLEHMGGNLFRISIYPVPKNGVQKIELTYSQTVEFHAGLYKYVYPLKTGAKTSRTLEDFTVAARLTSSIPLKNIYSPSHNVGISRKGDTEAVIGFEEDKSALDRDFILYFGISEKDFGLNLLTHATRGEDGYFMMLLAPSVMPKDAHPMPKDVTFVLDTSGSMAGKKITQACAALEYCVNRLNDGDRFNVVRFSTDVEAMSDKLLTVDAAARKQAITFIRGLSARGGTAIDAALAQTLSADFAADRPSIVVFLTDGKPTIGESDTDTIVKHVAEKNAKGVRLFVFGVGDTVNTHLLDRLSGGNGGVSEYVGPDEEIEEQVSLLGDRISHPVLSKVNLVIDTLKTSRIHPRQLPDLFGGDQLSIFGRYKDEGHVAIHLTGEVNGAPREFVYETTFPASNADNTFISRLWATRRVGYLLDEIRLHGENGELKDEVVALSKEFGIMTPYTSYLVLENDDAYRQHGIGRPHETGVAATSRGGESPSAPDMFVARRDEEKRARDKVAADTPPSATVPVFSAEPEAPMDLAIAAGASEASVDGAAPRPAMKMLRNDRVASERLMKNDSGDRAVALSRTIREYKEQMHTEELLATVRHIGRKTFTRIGDRWVDSAFTREMKVRAVTFASDAYFALLTEHPELKDVLALGDKVTVVLEDGSALTIE